MWPLHLLVTYLKKKKKNLLGKTQVKSSGNYSHPVQLFNWEQMTSSWSSGHLLEAFNRHHQSVTLGSAETLIEQRMEDQQDSILTVTPTDIHIRIWMFKITEVLLFYFISKIHHYANPTSPWSKRLLGKKTTVQIKPKNEWREKSEAFQPNYEARWWQHHVVVVVLVMGWGWGVSGKGGGALQKIANRNYLEHLGLFRPCLTICPSKHRTFN